MGNEIGLVAVTLFFGVPIAALYTYYRVRKLRTEEKLAAIARGVNVPMEPELSQVARSRRAGILLTAGAIGFMITFSVVGRTEPDALTVVAFGAIPLALGLGFFLDSVLVRRDLRV
jgi:preprotein translocase subunit Sss1